MASTIFGRDVVVPQGSKTSGKGLRRDLGDFFGIRPRREEEERRFAEQVVPRAVERLGFEAGAGQGIGTERQAKLVEFGLSPQARAAGTGEGRLSLDVTESANVRTATGEQQLGLANLFSKTLQDRGVPLEDAAQMGTRLSLQSPEQQQQFFASLQGGEGRGFTQSFDPATGELTRTPSAVPSALDVAAGVRPPEAAARPAPFDPLGFARELQSLPDDASRLALYDQRIAEADSVGDVELSRQLRQAQAQFQSAGAEEVGGLGLSEDVLAQFTEVTPEAAAQARGFEEPGIRDRFTAFREDVGEGLESGFLGIERFIRSLSGRAKDPVGDLSRQNIEFLDILANDPTAFDRLTPEQQDIVRQQIQERFGGIEEIPQFQFQGSATDPGRGSLQLTPEEIQVLKALGL